MRHLKRVVLFLLAVAFILSIPSIAFADRKTTNYYVRVFAGDQGSFSGQQGDHTPVIIQGSYNDTSKSFALDNNLTINDPEKYVAIGIREAGKDNNTAIGKNTSGSVTIPQITKDIDYVVAYAIPGQVTTYTVQYLDYNTGEDISSRVVREAGETIDSITHFYGIIGATITVAHRYIEGYTPRFDGTRKTLSADASQNVFPLYYTKNATATTTTTTTTTTTVTGGGAAVAGGAAANANNAANNQNANNPNANNQQPNGTNTPAPNIPGNVVINDNGEEILDLDVPLAAPNIPGVGTVSVPNAPQVIEPNQHGRVPNWMLIAGAVLLVGLISVLYWYLLFYRKKKKYASLNEDYDILDFDKDDDF